MFRTFPLSEKNPICMQVHYILCQPKNDIKIVDCKCKFSDMKKHKAFVVLAMSQHISDRIKGS